MTDLRKAAQALIDRWDTPDWKDAPHTGEYINALRAALAEQDAEPVGVSERERVALLLHAAGRVLQAFDDGYLQPDTETLQGGIAVDALRNAWGAFVPAVYRKPT